MYKRDLHFLTFMKYKYTLALEISHTREWEMRRKFNACIIISILKIDEVDKYGQTARRVKKTYQRFRATMNNRLSRYVRSWERAAPASWRAREEKNVTYTLHLGVLEGVSSETPTTRLCLYYCQHTYLCAEVEEGEKGRRWDGRRKDSPELVITESITRSYL